MIEIKEEIYQKVFSKKALLVIKNEMEDIYIFRKVCEDYFTKKPDLDYRGIFDKFKELKELGHHLIVKYNSEKYIFVRSF